MAELPSTSGDLTLDLLAFGAHPDDVELTISGLLCKMAFLGYSTGVVDLTRGEKGTRGTPEERDEEAQEAASIMNLKARVNLNLSDTDIPNKEENRLKVIEVLRKLRPSVIVIPYWQCRHPDHANASKLIEEAAFLSGLRKIDTGHEAFRPLGIVHYMTWVAFEPSFVVDISEHFEKKRQAIMAYKSQFVRPETMRGDVMQFIETRDRFYGAMIGASYGEPFLVKGPLRLEDPVAPFLEI